MLQVVVQGIPWAYTDEDLAGLFHEVGSVEQSSVVYSKDGRSRVCLSMEPTFLGLAHGLFRTLWHWTPSPAV